MKIIVDTNVALDILLKRPDYINAKVINLMAEQKVITGDSYASSIFVK